MNDELFALLEAEAETDEQKQRVQRVRRLYRFQPDRVDLVDAGANRREFAVRKDEAGMAHDDLSDSPLTDLTMLVDDGDDLYFGDPDFDYETDVADELAKAEWPTSFVNDLPDSAFLYVEPGGEKDDEGKTTPRSKRHFPVRDDGGKLDLPHLRNALARIPQANIPDEAKAAAAAKAKQLLEGATETEKAEPPPAGAAPPAPAPPTPGPPQIRAKTSLDAGHTHTAIVDQKGNGKTDAVNGHAHEVRGWNAAPAGDPEHTHTVNKPGKRDDGAVAKAALIEALTGASERLLELLTDVAKGEQPADMRARTSEIIDSILAAAGGESEDQAVATENTDIAKKGYPMGDEMEPKMCPYDKGNMHPATHAWVYDEGKMMMPYCPEHEAMAKAEIEKAGFKPEAKKKLPEAKKMTKSASGIFAQADALVAAEEAEIMKRGRKMSKARFEKFREAVKALLEVAKELDPSDTAAMFSGSLEKRTEALAEHVEAEKAKAEAEAEADKKKKAKAKADAEAEADAEKGKVAKSEDAIDDGNANTDADVAKRRGDSGGAGGVGWHLDLNNPDLFRESADAETAFFD